MATKLTPRERPYRLVISIDGRRVNEWTPTTWLGVLCDVRAFRQLQAMGYLRDEATIQVETREHGDGSQDGLDRHAPPC